jgi:hypothetical protein
MLAHLFRSLSCMSIAKPNFMPLFSSPTIFKRIPAINSNSNINPPMKKINSSFVITLTFERTILKLFDTQEFVFEMGETSGLYVGNLKGRYFESSHNFGSAITMKPLSLDYLPYNDRKYQRRTNATEIVFSKNTVNITLTDESGNIEHFIDKLKNVNISYDLHNK